MKVKNIAFSGFMAAIMLSTGSAMAAPQIASKGYVDNKANAVVETVTALETKINNADYASKTEVTNQITNAITSDGGVIKAELDKKANKTELDNLATKTELESKANAADLTSLTTTVNDAQTGLAATKTIADKAAAAAAAADTKAGNAQTTANEAKTAALTNAGEITALKTAVDGKQDKLGYTAEDAENKIAELNATASEADKARTYPTAGAVMSYVDTELNKAITEGIEINTDKIKDGAITSVKIQDGAVTEAKLDSALADKVNGAQTSTDVADAITKALTEEGGSDVLNQRFSKVIPYPSVDCQTGVKQCVLAVQGDAMVWLDVTQSDGTTTGE